LNKIQLANEVKYAEGMLSRRADVIERIGKAESRHEAIEAYRSMCGALREVRKHQANILSAIDDSTATVATKVMGLLMTATGWVSLARTDLVRFGLTESEIGNIDREVGV
jgi:hypothetical protein